MVLKQVNRYMMAFSTHLKYSNYKGVTLKEGEGNRLKGREERLALFQVTEQQSIGLWYKYRRVMVNAGPVQQILNPVLHITFSSFYTKLLLIHLNFLRPMKSLSFICPSVTNFCQDWFISFSWYCTWW